MAKIQWRDEGDLSQSGSSGGGEIGRTLSIFSRQGQLDLPMDLM